MYIAQAFKIKHNWWRYLVGLFIVFIGWQTIGVVPLMVVAFFEAGDLQTFLKASTDSFMSLGINSNLFLVLIIFSFAMGLAGIWFSNRFLHEQKFSKLTTSRAKVDWSRIWFSFFLVIIINAILFAISYVTEPEIYQLNFKLVPFILLLLIALFLLPLQTSFEEYLFRGYLMQGIGVIVKNKWVPLLITSVIFGLLHGLNPEVEKLGYIIMVYYIGTGFLLGIMTLMDEGMELALGFHAANNILAAVLVTTSWSALQTDAIFIDTSEPTAGLTVIVPMLIQYPIFLLILAKKYKWSGWKDKLFGKVQPENIVIEDNQ
ncbi:CPBP family intramembrane metalloprotease [Aquimarina addita]|uniref:CPBP family intramembrane metalloprotease n=1 Tax=Aquimarina addita TaxID=870485 RepID=A0ABP6UV21_9FLAO